MEGDRGTRMNFRLKNRTFTSQLKRKLLGIYTCIWCNMVTRFQARWKYSKTYMNKGHIGDGAFVPCREVVLFSEVLFLTNVL